MVEKSLLGNDELCDVIELGSIKFKMLDGSVEVLDNVKLIPKFIRNLISLGLFLNQKMVSLQF